MELSKLSPDLKKKLYSLLRAREDNSGIVLILESQSDHESKRLTADSHQHHTSLLLVADVSYNCFQLQEFSRKY